MDYLPIKDLKKTKAVRERLASEHELVVTKDGTPFALLVEVSPDTVEESVSEVRRALFSMAVMRARERARKQPPAAGEVEREIARSRAERRAR
jgi:hypothetical protein